MLGGRHDTRGRSLAQAEGAALEYDLAQSARITSGSVGQGKYGTMGGGASDRLAKGGSDQGIWENQQKKRKSSQKAMRAQRRESPRSLRRSEGQGGWLMVVRGVEIPLEQECVQDELR